MTTSAKRILETPMAPYTDLLLSMKPQEMRIVVTFLNEAIAESEKAQKTAAEIIREKYKNLPISQETKDLVRGLSLSSEEMNDERTQYLLGYRR
jgi:sialic acid synthase SpsE